MDIAALVISGCAFITSAWTAWLSVLKPARLQVDFRFVGVGLAGSERRAVIAIPLSVTNVGARSESITDALLIERGPGGKALFSSWVSIRPDAIEAFFSGKAGDKPIESYIESTKSAFLAPPNTQTQRTVVFEPCRTNPILADGLKLEYEVVLCGSRQSWRGKHTVTWLNGTKKKIATEGAVLVEVDESIFWRHRIADSAGINLADESGTFGSYDY